MAQVYANLIKKGLKTIEQVPEVIRGDVQGILDAENAPKVTDRKATK